MGKRLLKIFLFTILFFVVLATLTVILHMRTNLISDSLRSFLNRTLSDVAEIEYSTLKGDLFQEIQLRDLRLRFRNGITLETNKLDIQYSALASISSEFHFDEILFDSLKVIINKPRSNSQADSALSYQDFLTAMTEAGWYRDFISVLPDIKIGDLEVRHAEVEIPANNMTINKIYLGLSGYVNSQRIDVDIKKSHRTLA